MTLEVLDTVSVVIPVHPARMRNGMLDRAVRSVHAQTLVPEEIIIAEDRERQGAAYTRQSGLDKVDPSKSRWVAFLDSDDEFLPCHLDDLLSHAGATGADYVYSHYRVQGGSDPRPWSLGKTFDPENPHQTTIVTLVKTELAQKVGFLRGQVDPKSLSSSQRKYGAEDWQFTLGCVAEGAKIVHLPKVTWIWHHHGRNTSGLMNKGDACL